MSLIDPAGDEAVRASEEHFLRHFDLGLIGMAITSPKDGILKVNDEFCRIVGYERWELLEKTWSEMTHPDDMAADVAVFDKVMAGGIESYTLDKRWVRGDGTVIHSTVSAKCTRRADGSVDYLVGLVLDTTERRRAEAELRRSEAYLAEAEGDLRRALEEIRTLKDRLAEKKLYLEEEIRAEQGFEEIVGRSAGLRQILGQVETVAPTDATVLIQGETGTGKELIARAIHRLSSRRERTFVKINCAAIPANLLESELFGHEKGAFTGAIAHRMGRFELAHQGTIFLDEVGEIPVELQTKFLRILQEREFERVGSARTIHVDVRLIAATNSNLRQLVTDGKVRGDLFYRLNVFPIVAPPLRERAEDIPLLVWHFTRRHAAKLRRPITRISSETMTALQLHSWPGNVRELENLVERSVILSRGTILEVPLGELYPAGTTTDVVATGHDLELVEREAIVTALRLYGGNVTRVASELHIARSTLYLKIRKHGLDVMLSKVRPARH